MGSCHGSEAFVTLNNIHSVGKGKLKATRPCRFRSIILFAFIAHYAARKIDSYLSLQYDWQNCQHDFHHRLDYYY